MGNDAQTEDEIRHSEGYEAVHGSPLQHVHFTLVASPPQHADVHGVPQNPHQAKKGGDGAPHYHGIMFEIIFRGIRGTRMDVIHRIHCRNELQSLHDENATETQQEVDTCVEWASSVNSSCALLLNE